MKKTTPRALRRLRALCSTGKQDELWFFSGLSEKQTGLPVILYIGRGFLSKKLYFWIGKRLSQESRIPTLCALLILGKTMRWRSWRAGLKHIPASQRQQITGFVRAHKNVFLAHWKDPYLDFEKACEALQKSMERFRQTKETCF